MTPPKIVPQRFCPVCGNVVVGRAGKRFCRTRCAKVSSSRRPEAVVAHRGRNKRWSVTNAERMRELVSNWRASNPDKYREQMRRANEKVALIPQKRANRSVSRAVGRSIERGSKWGRSTFAILGYSRDDLCSHLERLFLDGMTWENYGRWHIDHIIPLSAFNYETPDDLDFSRAWELSNLRPLWALDNVKKGARIDAPFQPSLAISAPKSARIPGRVRQSPRR